MAKVSNGASSGWEGYAKVSAVPLEIRAYVVDRKGTGARRLRDTATLTRRLDRLLPWQPNMPNDAVAGVTLVEGTFQSSAVPHGIPETPGIHYVASWAGSDANVGRCAFGPFSCAREAAILVPILTGPDSTNQSVRIVDAASGTSLAELVNPRIDHH